MTTFIGTCIDSDGESIREMINSSEEITRLKLKKCIGEFEYSHVCEGLGYAKTKRDGLTMKNDWHVRYFKGIYQGKPVVFLRWSGIEYIWRTEE
jgi:hypothetical protein